MAYIRKGSVTFLLLVFLLLVFAYAFLKNVYIAYIASFVLTFLVVEFLSTYEFYIPLLAGAILTIVGILVNFYSVLLQEIGAMVSPLSAVIEIGALMFKFGNPVSFSMGYSLFIWALIGILATIRIIIGRQGIFYYTSYYFRYLLSKEIIINALVVLAVFIIFLEFAKAPSLNSFVETLASYIAGFIHA